MKRKLTDVELLAPAGSVESFYAAINAGADAIYLAGNRFGARAYADNFTIEELRECIPYAHLFSVKVYLTVNTLLYQEEIADLYSYILPIYEAGLDAVIVQDFGVFTFIRDHFPGLELHASTQMTLCSTFGAQYLKDNGATRIVPARELSLEELSEIKRNVDIELETFIHGAMCYCYSGQCLFSSILGGRSGNRGRCAQPCRLPYERKEKSGNSEYLLSMKDMCTIQHIPDLMEAGIDSFKIEGRMKKPEYVAGVTAYYRKYIDQYKLLRSKYDAEEAKAHFRIENEDLNNLKSLYMRSRMQDGYYYRYHGREMITLSNPAYTESKASLLEYIRQTYVTQKKKLDISVRVVLKKGMKAAIFAECGTISVSAEGQLVEEASRQPMTKETVLDKISRFGDTPFHPTALEAVIEDNIFYPVKALNELRREVVNILKDAILQEHGYFSLKALPRENPAPFTRQKQNLTVNQENTFSVSVVTLEQLRAVADWQNCNRECTVNTIYLESDLYLDELDQVKGILNGMTFHQLFLALPYIFRKKDENYMEQIVAVLQESNRVEGVLVRNYDELQYFLSYHDQLQIRLDANCYVWNRQSMAHFFEHVDGICLPYELNFAKQRELIDASEGKVEKVIYGRIPMMITANCIKMTTKGCSREDKEIVSLTDRYHKSFPVMTDCRHCLNRIYNSVPLYLKKEASKWKKISSLRIDFTIENNTEVEQILDLFYNDKGCCFEYTTGHEKRGVE